MKQLLQVRSNMHYTQEERINKVELNPMMELILIHTDGNDYKVSAKGLEQKPKLSEARMTVSPEMLESLITDLQLHQKNLNRIRMNADKINALIKHVEPENQKD